MKKLLIAVVVLFALAGLALLSLPSLLHKDTVRADIVTAFKRLTGMELEIQGDVSVVTLPSPHVVIHFMDVHNAPGAASPFLLEIQSMEVWPSFASLFGSQFSIEKIVVNGVDVELEHMKNDQMNWRDNSLQSPGAGGSSGGIFSSTAIVVTDGMLRFTNSVSNSTTEFDNVTGVMNEAGGDKGLKLNLKYNGRPFMVTGHVGDVFQLVSSGTVPADLNIKSGQSFLAYKGDVGMKGNHPFFKGNAAFSTDDIVPLLHVLFGDGAPKAYQPQDAAHQPLPLKASSDIDTQADKIIFPDVTLDGTVIKGGLQATVTFPNHVDVKSLINTLDLETLIESGLFDTRDAVADAAAAAVAAGDEPALATAVQAKLPFNSVLLSGDINITDTLYNGQHLKDAHFMFDTADGDVNIPQASIVLPGDSHIVFAGLGKEGYQGFAIEGAIDASGNDFVQMLNLFKSKGFSLPAEDFKRFRLKANTVISAKDMRLSEIAARIENIGLVGGAIATFGKRTALQAALRVQGVNLDHFMDLWGLQEWRTSFLEDTPGPKREGFLSQWLKHLGYDMTFNTTLEQYVLNGKVRDKTDFKMQATTGEITFKNVKTSYNGTQITGDVGINVSQTLPRLTLDLTADTVNPDILLSADGLAPAAASQNSPADRWSHQQFDFHWMSMLNAAYHLRFGHYQNGNLQAEKVDIQGTIGEQNLNVDSLTALMMGAPVAGKAVISGGKIPGINLAVDVKGIDVSKILHWLPVLQDINGKYNVTMRLDTNGTDLYSWMSNLEGNIGIGGRDIAVHDFNIMGVINAVNYVRTVADIVEVVKRALPSGDTVFPSMQGEWVVNNGTLQASNLILTGKYASGLLVGSVDLVNWKTQCNITFALSSLDSTHPPSIIVSYGGNLDTPERLLDTRSLEQYVTNKTSEKMLDQYGTH